MPATTSRPNPPMSPAPTRPPTVALVDTTSGPRVSGSKRPVERNVADQLEPHWVAAIDAATD